MLVLPSEYLEVLYAKWLQINTPNPIACKKLVINMNCNLDEYDLHVPMESRTCEILEKCSN